MNLSPWAYNLSLANRYFPLTESQVQNEKLNWHAKETGELSKLTPQALPDGLPASDEALVTACSVSGKLFRITSQEIKRLRKFSAPLPRMAYDVRMDDRAKRCGGLILTTRTCASSGEKLETVYTKEEAPIIWSKDVFDREFA